MPQTALAQQERFWSKVGHLHRPDLCWPWLVGRFQNGHGMFWKNGRYIGAHRRAWELTRGQIPAGLVLDHYRMNPGPRNAPCSRACVNPSHLELVTPRENNIRGAGVGGMNARKTHCPNGHPYDMVYGIKKQRGCKRCIRISALATYSRAHGGKVGLHPSKRTECIRGHPFDFVAKDGRRGCRRCKAIKAKRYNDKGKSP